MRIPEDGQKDGLKALRLVRSLDPGGEMFRRGIWNRATGIQHLSWSYGYLKGRRREGAMLVHSSICWRLRQCKVEYTNTFFDMANAFMSPEKSELDGAADSHCKHASDAHLMKDHHYFSMTRIECCDDELTLAVGRGNLPGDTISCLEFLTVYEPIVESGTGRSMPPLDVH